MWTFVSFTKLSTEATRVGLGQQKVVNHAHVLQFAG
jgi:hypothetical protein